MREEVLKLLKRHGQEHVLRFWDELTEPERETLAAQIEAVDFSLLSKRESQTALGSISPIGSLSVEEIANRKRELFSIGCGALQKGKLAAVLLAGGQGTRLGSDRPKGTFNMGITHDLPIFRLLVENLKSVCRACETTVPLLVMTSEKNDGETRAFFGEHDYFGYPKEYVRFFIQDMAASCDLRGKLLLEEKGRLARSPNGNGGWYSSLERAGLLKDGLLERVEWFNVFSVDNVLQGIADPVFLGASIQSGCLAGAKVVKKTRPEEKVGVLCLNNGVPYVVEYYELPPEMANEREGEELKYRFGVTLNYLFSAQKLKEIAEEEIPVHVVKKAIPHLNEAGELVEPDAPNGYKFETLILDTVALMGSCLAFEVVREREFAPVKNRTGVDSVETARRLLQENGVIL